MELCPSVCPSQSPQPSLPGAFPTKCWAVLPSEYVPWDPGLCLLSICPNICVSASAAMPPPCCGLIKCPSLSLIVLRVCGCVCLRLDLCASGSVSTSHLQLPAILLSILLFFRFLPPSWCVCICVHACLRMNLSATPFPFPGIPGTWLLGSLSTHSPSWPQTQPHAPSSLCLKASLLDSLPGDYPLGTSPLTLNSTPVRSCPLWGGLHHSASSPGPHSPSLTLTVPWPSFFSSHLWPCSESFVSGGGSPISLTCHSRPCQAGSSRQWHADCLTRLSFLQPGHPPPSGRPPDCPFPGSLGSSTHCSSVLPNLGLVLCSPRLGTQPGPRYDFHGP